MKKLNLLISIQMGLLFFVIGCGGDGGKIDQGGESCNAFSARSKSGSEKVFNGETCDQNARTPVVAVLSILDNGSIGNICSGTLVTVDDILTSAHCFIQAYSGYGDSVAGFVAVVGGAEGEVIDLNQFALHPKYDGSVGTRFDLAMATLSKIPTPAIGPVPILISQLTLPGQRMSTYGYGTSNNGEIGTLKAAEITIESISNGNLIASFVTNNASVCAGDSGGPVVQVVNGTTTIVGVNSFGIFNGGQCPEIPAAYSGFVDLQNSEILEFLGNYSPDIPIA